MLLVKLAPALALVSLAHSQSIDWASFQEDSSRVVAAPNLGLADNQEKDFAWGDLDRDGWTDLVVVRKRKNLLLGKRVNVLLMNEGGTLVDRTAQFASATDVPGDMGFLTPTSDRDVAIVDVNGDGWDDVVVSHQSSDSIIFAPHPFVVGTEIALVGGETVPNTTETHTPVLLDADQDDDLDLIQLSNSDSAGANATIAYGGDLISVLNTSAAQLDTDQFDFIV